MNKLARQTAETLCELSTVKHQQVATRKIDSAQRSDTTATIWDTPMWPCSKLGHSQPELGVFREPVLGLDAHHKHKHQNIKSMKHRQMSKCFFFTTGIPWKMKKTRSKGKGREIERRWQLPDGLNEARWVLLYIYQVKWWNPTATPSTPCSAVFVWLSGVNSTVSLALQDSEQLRGAEVSLCCQRLRSRRCIWSSVGSSNGSLSGEHKQSSDPSAASANAGWAKRQLWPASLRNRDHCRSRTFITLPWIRILSYTRDAKHHLSMYANILINIYLSIRWKYFFDTKE